MNDDIFQSLMNGTPLTVEQRLESLERVLAKVLSSNPEILANLFKRP